MMSSQSVTVPPSKCGPPGTKRTAVYLSKVHPDMYTTNASDPLAATGSGRSGSQTPPAELTTGGRQNGVSASHSTTTVSSTGKLLPLMAPLSAAAATTPPSYSPTTPVPSTSGAASAAPPISFIASKRQTAFLLSIGTLPGAPAHPVGPANDGDACAVAADPSPLLVVADGSSTAAAWTQRLPAKCGDKIRFRLTSIHLERGAPVVVSSMLATFGVEHQHHLGGSEERVRPLGIVGASSTNDLLLAARQETLAALTSFHHASDASPSALLSSTSDPRRESSVAPGSPEPHAADSVAASLATVLSRASSSVLRRSHEVSYISKFQPDHMTKVLASPQFSNPFYLDDPDITGERRRKRMHLRAYLCTVISFADKRSEKKDINRQFFQRHPLLELKDIKLSHIRSIKTSLLQLCLEESSPLELATIAYATWYFERLITGLHVTKQNRKLMVAVSVTLSIKFWESGNVARKLQYAWTKMEDLFGVDTPQVKAAEFLVFAALEFTLLPASFSLGMVYTERLLHIMNIGVQEYYSKNFDQRILWEA